MIGDSFGSSERARTAPVKVKKDPSMNVLMNIAIVSTLAEQAML
jgi:hypothetical protein